MARVEHPQLECFPRLHVGDQHRSGELPRWAGGGEVVLDHPLPERLGDHRRLVPQPGPRPHLREVVGGGGGHDPVDHRGGEPHVLGHPRRQLGEPCCVDELLHQPPQGPAVGGQVVATDHGDRSGTGSGAALQPAHQLTHDRPRWTIREVGQHLVVGQVEVTGRRIVPVPLLRHGERDDADVLARQQFDHRRRIDALAAGDLEASVTALRAHLRAVFGDVERIRATAPDLFVDSADERPVRRSVTFLQ